MKSKSSNAGLVLVFLVLFIVSSWCVNFYRFVTCDFEPTYKAEVLYGIGVFVVPTFVVTAWIDIDD